MSKIKLYCFPYAGGSATIYNKWRTYLNPNIQLVPMEMAGRGVRFKEDFYQSIAEAVNDLYTNIDFKSNHDPYAFFGHSMGSILVYELCRKIAADNQKGPAHIFVSGMHPPHIKKERKILHQLPLAEFKEEVIKMGGTPREVFENQELMDYFVPIIKADYKIYETYEFLPNDTKFDFGITAFNGLSDKPTFAEMLEWGNYTSDFSKLYQYEGDHFFIHNHTAAIVDVINKTLSNFGMK
ncbi:MAG: thioesterase [Firmicutes bacterium]|nr:thioesterase [Bacillota bacterium]